VFARIGDAFALHGACVARNGKGVLISGPSGFGKTTLAIHLALRGFQFLSDDLVLIDRRTGRLEPVRRGVHLRAGSRRMLDAASRARAKRAARRLSREEWTIDPDRWLGPAAGCGEVGLVLLLRPEADLRRVRRLHVVELAFSEGRRRLPRSLAAAAGLRVRGRSPDGRHWRIEADDPASIGAWIEARPEGLRGWAKVTDTSPCFDGEPRAVSIGRFQAAIELAQEIVNRGPRSRLGAGYTGREAELPIDLASRLGKARCYALVPGRLEETVRLVERLFDAISPRPPGRAAPR
jgi:DNA polymerase III delta prime subunit